ncbi:MAG: TlpA family protein disulfide reductase [Deltaproteobacteria bacterium]|nr:TlpA family protein disulfide reductase [Deltaproteobacteria bacterium]
MCSLSMKKNFIFIVVIFLLGYFLYSALFSQSGLAIGKAAPLFTVETPGHEPFQLKDHIGKKVILLNLWATWCPACREEIPVLNQIQSELDGAKFMMVSIMLDETKDAQQKHEALNRFKEKIPIHFPVYFDNGFAVADAYGTYKLPESYIIDLNGVVSYKHVGPIMGWDKNDIIERIKQL